MTVAMKIFALYNRRYSYIQTFAYFLEPTQISRLEKTQNKKKNASIKQKGSLFYKKKKWSKWRGG